MLLLEHLQRLSVERIEKFLDHRDVKKVVIPGALAKYIIEINDAYNLNKKYRSIAECSKQMPYLSLPIDPERIRFKPQIVSANIQLKRMMDSTSTDLLSAWNEIQSIVGKQEISQTDKERLLGEAKRELNIEDIEYEEPEDKD